MASPEELIAMGANPADAGLTYEELVAQKEKHRRRVEANSDASGDLEPRTTLELDVSENETVLALATAAQSLRWNNGRSSQG